MAGLTPPRPLTADDDRETFDCGRESLNPGFRRNAWRNQQSGASRTSIVCAPATGAVLAQMAVAAARQFLADDPHRPRRVQFFSLEMGAA
jgi:hypothetical protein